MGEIISLPSIITQTPGAGLANWTVPAQTVLQTADSAYASVLLAPEQSSTMLFVTGHILAPEIVLPSDAALLGIRTTVRWRSDPATARCIVYSKCKDVAGVPGLVGVNLMSTSPHLLPGIDTTDYRGANTYLWAYSWLIADLKDSDFGSGLQFLNESYTTPCTVYLDLVNETIYYIPAGGVSPAVCCHVPLHPYRRGWRGAGRERA
jgi:hypothetical protein